MSSSSFVFTPTTRPSSMMGSVTRTSVRTPPPFFRASWCTFSENQASKGLRRTEYAHFISCSCSRRRSSAFALSPASATISYFLIGRSTGASFAKSG